MLSRWGTEPLEVVLAPALEIAEGGIALTAGQAAQMNSRGLAKYPTSQKLYQPGGKKWQEGEIFKNLDLARTFHRLIKAERNAARDRFYKGDIARAMAHFAEENGGLMRYEDFASYEAKVEEPVSYNYRGYVVHKNPSASQGPAELPALSILQDYNLRCTAFRLCVSSAISRDGNKMPVVLVTRITATINVMFG